MPIGEAFLSASLQGLFDMLASPVMSELGKLYGVKGELAKLRRTLNRLKDTLQDAEQKKVEGKHFARWLRELKSAAYDAEDVVDEFEYEDLRRKVQISGEGSGGAIKSLLSASRKVRKLRSYLGPREVSFRHEMARRIGGIRRRLDEISKDNELLSMGGKLDVGVNLQPVCKTWRNDTTSLLAIPEVFGRDEVKHKLLNWLLGKTCDMPSSSSSSSLPSSSAVEPTGLSVLSIVGMGGLGKTTLAQWAYNNDQVREFFHPRIWVCVSQDFNLERVTKQILQHIVDPPSTFQTVDSLNVLQQNLSERLRGKRFLLILDDVWEEVYKNWCEFSASLAHGDKGSKVLITTRNPNIANTMRLEKIELEGLLFDDCWSIFRKHAFPNGDSDKYPILESIGRKIVKKLKGVPLAATTIGGLLRFESEERNWRNVLQRELWELEQGGEGIIPALRVSYEHLPQHLKPCFAYCSVFRKGHRFDMLELVQLWMAQGYVRHQERKSVEDVGRDYFNELFNRSLLLFINGKYVVHELLHDLGQHILQHDFYKMGPDQVHKIPEDAHLKCHLRLRYGKSLWGELEVLHKFCRVRTLEVVVKFDNKDEFLVPFNLFRAMKCLRVLELRSCHIETLPESIGYLKHLRYFDLSKTPVKCLPESLCALHKLQTLKLGGCDQLKDLPNGMSNLISLHYLEANHELVSKIANIGKLICLQNLEVFSISKKNGNRIGDLRNMNELRGKLCIQNLQRVETREEAFMAALKNKRYLEKLEMEWASDRDVDLIDNHLEESTIEGLQPPPHLKELTVKCYAGVNFPSWMNSSSISSLESFQVDRCINLNPFPPLEHSCFLRTLAITGCSQLKELPHLPPALRNLILRDVGLIALPNSLHGVPLEQLVACQILELKELPLLPATLKELTIEVVGLQALPEFCQDCELSAATAAADDEYKSSDNRKPLLSILKIHGCPHLTTLHEGLLKHHLRHLCVLSIKDCKELINWPEGEGFQSILSSLDKELSIERCPKLKALPEGSELHPSLKKLVVKACPGVQNRSLFSQVQNFDTHDVSVENWYCNLAHCADEALWHILVVDGLEIEYLQEGDGRGATPDGEESPPQSSPPPPPPPPVSFVYDRKESRDWEGKHKYMSRHMKLAIEGRRGGGRSVVDVNDGDAVDDGSAKLCTCLGDHPWTSSLRELTLHGIPDEAFVGVQSIHRHPLHLPSVETLILRHCREMRMLPKKTLLLHLTALKAMKINDCPELTLSAVEVGIRSVPSLRSLLIAGCPQLLMPPSSNPLLNNSDGDGEEDAFSSAPPPPMPPPPLLRYLFIDDAGLLKWLPDNNSHGGQENTGGGSDCGRFFRDHVVTSLRVLWIFRSELTSLTAEEEGGLSTLASSLQCLVFSTCHNLQNLPAGLRGLLPNLKVLAIDDCPGIRRLPNRGLPDSLEYLYIKGCPELAKRCRCRPGKHAMRLSTRGAEEDGDWHKIAHVPVVVVDGVYLQGSYGRYMELKANWAFYPC